MPEVSPDERGVPLARETVWVRHGESDWNARRVMQGQRWEPALTLRGREQAHAVGAELGGRRPEVIVSSDLRRACETARLIALRTGAPIRLTPLLRERAWGAFEGRGIEQGLRHEATLADHEPLPGGESRHDVRARLRLLSRHLDGHGQVVVVTHGDVLAAAVRLWGRNGPAPAVWGNGQWVHLRVPVPDQRRPAADGGRLRDPRAGTPHRPRAEAVCSKRGGTAW